jgi:NTP pyrophosphatase (non-canonical NTP hydrolase)
MKMIYYQSESQRTVAYRDKKIPPVVYCALGLAGEAGEVANKIKKVYRDEDGEFSLEKEEELAKELGDVLWYVAALANELGFSLAWVAEENLNKLKSRQERGVIGGSGDER